MPSRCTFDRRSKMTSINIKEKISIMGNVFVSEGLVKPNIKTTDSNFIKSQDKKWHKSSMNKGIVPCPGTKTAARLDYSSMKDWIFGYKLHIISSTGSIFVSLLAGVTTTNVKDSPLSMINLMSIS